MDGSTAGSFTQLLVAAAKGDADAKERVWQSVYDELRRLARHQLANERGGRALESTSLVHEAYLRLIGYGPVEWANRQHFVAVAALVMRHICVEGARKRARIKHGGKCRLEPLNDAVALGDEDPLQTLAIDEAMKKLEEVAPRQAKIITLRFFAGLGVEETAAALNVAPRTVNYEWRFARAWLHRELSRGDTKTTAQAT